LFNFIHKWWHNISFNWQYGIIIQGWSLEFGRKKANFRLSVLSSEWLVGRRYSQNSLASNKNKSSFIPFALFDINTPDQIIIKSYCNCCKGKQLTDIIYVIRTVALPMARIRSSRYLGVIFDDHLKWKLHICNNALTEMFSHI